MRFKLYWYDSILVVLLLYLFIAQLVAIWPFTIDDMYIPLRYAKHWTNGQGLLWNVQAPPVEGYSSFSFVVIGALSLLLKINPVLLLKWSGAIGLFFTCVFIYLITRFWFSPRQALLSVLGILAYQGQIIWAVSGLETTVYQALVCATVYFIFRGFGYSFHAQSLSKSYPFYFLYAGVAITLAAFTRPEAPALMVLFFVLILFQFGQLSRACWRCIVFFLLPILVFFLPYFIWRWHYYGFLFPNSVYCKGFVMSGWSMDMNYLKLIWPYALFSVFAMLKMREVRAYFLALPSLIYLLLLIGADPIAAFDNRLFLPAFVLLIPLTLKGISEVLKAIFPEGDNSYGFILTMLCILFAFLFLPAMSLAGYSYFSKSPVRGEELRLKVVAWLKQNAKEKDVVVLGDAGLIPYLSDLNYIDSYCLNHVEMAHYPPNERQQKFCQQVLPTHPQFFILTSLIKNQVTTYAPSDLCLKRSLSKNATYKMVELFSSTDPHSQYRYEVFTSR